MPSFHIHSFFYNLAVILYLFCLAGYGAAQDFTQLGGDTTTSFTGRFAIQLPAPNVVDEERRNLMLSGFAVFHKQFLEEDGGGPLMVNNSCGGCHIQNGRGPVFFSKSNIDLTSIVVKLSVAGVQSDGSPQPVPSVGGVLQNHTVAGKTRYSPSLKWRLVKGQYPDGRRYTLRAPKVSFKLPTKTRKVRHSLRMSPAIIGVGLIEAISEGAILERVDRLDLNTDGISGTPNYVIDKRLQRKVIGKFGYKASQPTVEQQSLVAFHGEMGVTNELFNSTNLAPEFGGVQQEQLIFYQKLAGVPAATNQTNPDVIAGKQIFFDIGCETCHRATFVTDSVSDPELANQIIHPFSDFLLHNMGTGLADKHNEFSARGFEWRTTPLWGLGFSSTISEVKPRYLHDGRARTIEEAILWHAGEAKASQQRFKNLARQQRLQLLKFLASL